MIIRLRLPHYPIICKSRPRLVFIKSTRGGHDTHASNVLPPDEWQLRARRKVCSEVVAAGARLGLQAAFLEHQLDMFHSLLPNLPINLEQMRASDWAQAVTDPDLAAKVVLLKVAFPSLNVELLLSKYPRVLRWSRQRIQESIEQTAPVFQLMPRPEVVLEVLPELLDPKQCFSVVATLCKWYPKRDPLEVLQADPDVVRRAEAWDVPLEPVFLDATTGTWTAAGYSRTKQEDWQIYIEQQIYKRKPQPIDKQEAVVVGGAAAAANAIATSAAVGAATATSAMTTSASELAAEGLSPVAAGRGVDGGYGKSAATALTPAGSSALAAGPQMDTVAAEPLAGGPVGAVPDHPTRQL